MTRKPKPDAWPLRPGDLPPEWILRREPRLRGLEENAYFRLLQCTRRRSSSLTLELEWIGASPLELSPEEMALLPISLDKIASAYWGYTAARRARIAVYWAAAACLAVSFVWMLIEINQSGRSTVVSIWLSALAGYHAARNMSGAEGALFRCVEFARRRCRSASREERTIFGGVRADSAKIIAATLFLTFFGEPLIDGLLSAACWTFASAICGGLFGVWRIGVVRRNRDLYLKKLADDLGFILERSLEARDQRRGAEAP